MKAKNKKFKVTLKDLVTKEKHTVYAEAINELHAIMIWNVRLERSRRYKNCEIIF